MARLEDLTKGALVKGVRTDGPVEVVDVTRFGTSAIELTFEDVHGTPGNELVYRTDEPRLDVQARAQHGASVPTAPVAGPEDPPLESSRRERARVGSSVGRPWPAVR